MIDRTRRWWLNQFSGAEGRAKARLQFFGFFLPAITSRLDEIAKRATPAPVRYSELGRMVGVILSESIMHPPRRLFDFHRHGFDQRMAELGASFAMAYLHAAVVEPADPSACVNQLLANLDQVYKHNRAGVHDWGGFSHEAPPA